MRFFPKNASVFFFLVSFLVWSQAVIAFPAIIPHRGGRVEHPENTLEAFQKCLELGAKTLELDVQVTKDGIAVVYHPSDLAANTNGTGKIADYNYEDLKKLDAAYNFKKGEVFLYRGKGYAIPTLKEVLEKFPETKFIIDLKSLPADKLLQAVAKEVDENKAWGRVVFYSTSDSHLEYLKNNYPHAVAFESRNATLEELLTPTGSTKIPASEKCIWIGFELVRDVILEESLALGKAQYNLELQCWNHDNLERIRNKLPKSHLVMFGVNTVEDYKKANELKADAVYTDNPQLLFDYLRSQEKGLNKETPPC